ncbi:hypothetical protein [Bradyrhizobium sp. CW1]|uniref:hypothetical protein n=1 Tax=Bradyrhizobium sp. CW1 TaxID=2782686 RepID=UPI002000394F|nr:hypothetical protein [Bradyrhizobium sp. CW1]UPJ31011.1 hypothetical protein IVB54_19400 [Bradyrhizobium sp. CW1]
MSEDRNDAGQFTPSTDGLYGREAEEAAAGFKAMPVTTAPEPSGDDELSTREAADALSASRAAAADEVVGYQKTETGEGADPNETVSLQRAATDLATYRASKTDSAAISISKDFAAEIDALRTAAIEEGLDPKETGIDKVPKTADVPAGASDKSGDEPAEPGMEHLDPEVQKALKIPAVKEALEREFAQADEAKAQFSQTLDVAQRLAQATLLTLAPGLANVPAHQLEGALQQLAVTDPARATAIVQALEGAQRIEFAQQHEQQRQAQVAHQQFEAQRQEYSRQADAALGPMTFAEKTQMVEDLVNYVGEFGISREGLMREAQTNLAIHHPAFQRMAADALMYRRMQNASKAVATRDIPPVQKPGTTGPRISSEALAVGGLEAKFHKSGNLKDAAAALMARRRAAR